MIPGGVSRNSVYRIPHPDYAAGGAGCVVTDVDGCQRIDFANNMCSLIHGHAHQPTIDAVTAQLQRGTAFTLATEAETRFARHLCGRNPGFEKIRFMNSGTEAVMCAIKLARAISGRPKIAKCEGTYHGTYDFAEVSQSPGPDNWGSIDQPNSVPLAKGTPQSALDEVVIIPFNDINRTLAILDRHVNDLAAVMIDPLPHRVGLFPAENEFVSALRDWTNRNNALLIFDEVISFRMSYGGAQDWFDARPDLTTLGKIIGGGFPVGAVAGKDEYMHAMDPGQASIPLPYSGTFSANPVTMTAGLATMECFDPGSIKLLNELGELTRRELSQAIQRTGKPFCVTGGGSMFRIHPLAKPPSSYRETYQDAGQQSVVRRLVEQLYQHGLMLIKTCSGALSTSITKDHVEQLVVAVEQVLRQEF